MRSANWRTPPVLVSTTVAVTASAGEVDTTAAPVNGPPPAAAVTTTSATWPLSTVARSAGATGATPVTFSATVAVADPPGPVAVKANASAPR